MTVESVLIINNFGKPRLAKFYRRPLISVSHQQSLIRTIFKLISQRDDDMNCNFLDAPELKPLLQRGEEANKGQELKVIYRHYATLWFVFVVDQSESELGILDLIQVFVESLDRFFPNVCELDLIFHYEEVNAILAEIIQGGLVLETNITEIVKQAQITSKARKTSANGNRSSAISNLTGPGLLSGTGGGTTNTGFDVGINAATAAAGWARDWISRR
ncbi:unnamed protein product [Sympodiomycopsis kandeliae]